MKVTIKDCENIAGFTHTVTIENNKIVNWYTENYREGGNYTPGVSNEEHIANIYLQCTNKEGENFINNICNNCNIKKADIKFHIINKYNVDIIKLHTQIKKITRKNERRISKLLSLKDNIKKI